MELEWVWDVSFDNKGEGGDTATSVATQGVCTQVNVITSMNSQTDYCVFWERLHISCERHPGWRCVFFVYFPGWNKNNIGLHMRVWTKDIPPEKRSMEWKKTLWSSAVKFITPELSFGEHEIMFYATQDGLEQHVQTTQLFVTEKLSAPEKQIEKRPGPCVFTKQDIAQLNKKIEAEEERRKKEKEDAAKKRDQERAERREKSIWNRLKKWWRSS